MRSESSDIRLRTVVERPDAPQWEVVVDGHTVGRVAKDRYGCDGRPPAGYVYRCVGLGWSTIRIRRREAAAATVIAIREEVGPPLRLIEQLNGVGRPQPTTSLRGRVHVVSLDGAEIGVVIPSATDAASRAGPRLPMPGNRVSAMTGSRAV